MWVCVWVDLGCLNSELVNVCESMCVCWFGVSVLRLCACDSECACWIRVSVFRECLCDCVDVGFCVQYACAYLFRVSVLSVYSCVCLLMCVDLSFLCSVCLSVCSHVFMHMHAYLPRVSYSVCMCLCIVCCMCAHVFVCVCVWVHACVHVGADWVPCPLLLTVEWSLLGEKCGCPRAIICHALPFLLHLSLLGGPVLPHSWWNRTHLIVP